MKKYYSQDIPRRAPNILARFIIARFIICGSSGQNRITKMIIKNEKLAKIAYWTEKTLRSGYFWAVFLPLFAFYLAYLCAGKSISFIALSFQSLAMFPWAILDSFGIAYGFGKLLSTLGIPYFIPVLICAGAFLFFVFKARTMKQRTLFILSTIFLILYILGLFGWIRILTLPILY